MTRCRGMACLNLASMCVALAVAQVSTSPIQAIEHVIERGGDIYAVVDTGIVQVTASGSDSEPDLSPDGKRVVFVRKINDADRELWMAGLQPVAPARRLLAAPVEVNGRKFSVVHRPRFSPDGAYVYFSVPYAAVTNAIVRVHVATGTHEFIAAAHKFTIISDGKYRGYLVARLRKAKLAPGYYDWYWLLTPEGKEVDLVGQDERDVALFLEQQQP